MAYGLIGAAGAIGAQVISGAIKPKAPVNGVRELLHKASAYTPVGLAAKALHKHHPHHKASNIIHEEAAVTRMPKLNGFENLIRNSVYGTYN